MEAAADELKRASPRGDVVSVSRNVFIPLTNLCRDRCAYCTFAKHPRLCRSEAPTPWTRWPRLVKGGVPNHGLHRGALLPRGQAGDRLPEPTSGVAPLRGMSRPRRTEHLTEACRVTFEGGMLPHTNAGILTAEEMARLRPYNASMGLMLESTSPRLRGKGMDRTSTRRTRTLEPCVFRCTRRPASSRSRSPAASCSGSARTTAERVDTLLGDPRARRCATATSRKRSSNPSTPSLGSTRMRAAVADLRRGDRGLGRDGAPGAGAGHRTCRRRPTWRPRCWRCVASLGPVNDWGGVSPVTVDFINPEAPWPDPGRAAATTPRRAGQKLVERLPVYPEFILDEARFLRSGRCAKRQYLRFATEDGYARPRAPGAPSEAA